MNSSFFGLVAGISAIITFVKWRKRKGEMTIVHALVWWILTIIVMIVAIHLANLLTDKFNA